MAVRAPEASVLPRFPEAPLKLGQSSRRAGGESGIDKTPTLKIYEKASVDTKVVHNYYENQCNIRHRTLKISKHG